MSSKLLAIRSLLTFLFQISFQTNWKTTMLCWQGFHYIQKLLYRWNTLCWFMLISMYENLKIFSEHTQLKTRLFAAIFLKTVNFRMCPCPHDITHSCDHKAALWFTCCIGPKNLNSWRAKWLKNLRKIFNHSMKFLIFLRFKQTVNIFK